MGERHVRFPEGAGIAAAVSSPAGSPAGSPRASPARGPASAGNGVARGAGEARFRAGLQALLSRRLKAGSGGCAPSVLRLTAECDLAAHAARLTDCADVDAVAALGQEEMERRGIPAAHAASLLKAAAAQTQSGAASTGAVPSDPRRAALELALQQAVDALGKWADANSLQMTSVLQSSCGAQPAQRGPSPAPVPPPPQGVPGPQHRGASGSQLSGVDAAVWEPQAPPPAANAQLQPSPRLSEPSWPPARPPSAALPPPQLPPGGQKEVQQLLQQHTQQPPPAPSGIHQTAQPQPHQWQFSFGEQPQQVGSLPQQQPPPPAQQQLGGGRKLFVGKLPFATTEDELRPHFEQCGPLAEVTIMRDKNRSNQSKGCAWVVTRDEETAKRCIENFHNQTVFAGQPGPLVVRYAEGGSAPVIPVPPPAPAQQGKGGKGGNKRGRKVFVGQLPRTMTEHQLRPVMEQVGAVDECVLIRDRSTQQSKGCAFVVYASRQSAQAAVSRLNDSVTHQGARGPMQVSFAPGMEPCPVKLFVGQLPGCASEEELRALFSAYGELKEVHMLRDRESNRHKGAAFITFEDAADADDAAAAVNGHQWAERRVVVKRAESDVGKGKSGKGGLGAVDAARLALASAPVGAGGQVLRHQPHGQQAALMPPPPGGAAQAGGGPTAVTGESSAQEQHLGAADALRQLQIQIYQLSESWLSNPVANEALLTVQMHIANMQMEHSRAAGCPEG
eukprot:TRINITY_DN2695_c0_g1_i2.p1 TRINITY_DN2695_c0_g1~~TRINITY_DN2695_c0_g1_i2.p1  ORF type:complete len:758 (+),score=182.48 TRINITY_DN2695_c0_g1_i2:84-2276(+)